MATEIQTAIQNGAQDATATVRKTVMVWLALAALAFGALSLGGRRR